MRLKCEHLCTTPGIPDPDSAIVIANCQLRAVGALGQIRDLINRFAEQHWRLLGIE